MRRLLERIGVSIREPKRFEQALTHRSAGSHHNERLEFLGDAVLELVVTDWIFEQFPDATEGELTRLRARMVRKETLAGIARELDVGAALALGGGERKAGGRYRDGILADAFEALVGAIYVDCGLDECVRVIRQVMRPCLQRLHSEPLSKDPKTRLQEWLQSRGHALPVYEVSETFGAAHEQEFIVRCTVQPLLEAVTGRGSSRRRAEQQAAAQALERLERPTR